MKANVLENFSWYTDRNASENSEPGIHHSYMKSLATALNYINGDIDPAWLMGSSAFAFRIFVNENLCPSAMSIFDFSAILPETIEQSGYHALYICRYWNDEANEQIRREEAQRAIIAGIDRRVPAVVWDVFDAEWGLIIGYDSARKVYHILTHRGEKSFLPFDRLGRNGIDILSVSIIGESNRRTREEIILNSLKTAVFHAEQNEWVERPKYQNGLAAYDLWASFYEKAAMIVEAGKGNNVKQDIWNYAAYYANHFYSARCYARDYLKIIANGDGLLTKAASCYERVSKLLKPIWYHMAINRNLHADTLGFLAQNIKEAKQSEEEGIQHIKAYLKKFSV
jgi:hypothetical protein